MLLEGKSASYACGAQVLLSALAVSSPPLPHLPFHRDSRTCIRHFSQQLTQFINNTDLTWEEKEKIHPYTLWPCRGLLFPPNFVVLSSSFIRKFKT